MEEEWVNGIDPVAVGEVVGEVVGEALAVDPTTVGEALVV
jgi:hypothetical protein